MPVRIKIDPHQCAAKVTGAWEKRCDWARVGQGREAAEAAPGEGGLGGKAQGREQESGKVFPEFRALRRGWKSLEQYPRVGMIEALCPSGWWGP